MDAYIDFVTQFNKFINHEPKPFQAIIDKESSMNHIHVCLVSDQTIPNILSIHHFKPDELLFITTSEMEKKHKSKHVLLALENIGLNYQDKYHLIKVQEDSILDCKKKIDEWIIGKENAIFTVNLTCGTKIMSIAVYECFKDYGSKIIYIPVGKNEYITTFPKNLSHKIIPLSLRLSVADYLAAYGLNIINAKKLELYKNEAINRKGLTTWLIENYEHIKNLLIWLSGNLRTHRDDKQYFLKGDFHDAKTEDVELLKKMNFDTYSTTISKNLSRSEIRFLTGGWLEEFSLNVINEFIGKGIDDVVIDIKLKNVHGGDNEFDLMFTKDNALYFVECKSLDQHDDKDLNALYKVGALQKDFGIRVKSFFITTSPYIMKDGKLKSSIQARAEQFSTEIIPPDQVKDFKKLISQKLKIG